MIDVRKKILTVSQRDINVLVTGETGTGKELIARSIHFHSTRNKEPLVKINCVALPNELLESEVFGFQKGAFTGAHQNKPGLLELADGGTLFIDEIGALSMAPQAKFLQVLEDKAFSRLGGIRDKTLDIRIVAATNADLRRMVLEGSFRKDLYYRLNIMPIQVSPLRERIEDVPLLIHYFLNKYCFELKREILSVPDDVINFFLSYHWPGNVRELQNVVERALIINPRGPLNFDHILPSTVDQKSYNIGSQEIKPEKLDTIISTHIRKVLSKTKGKIHGPGGAAELLGINASTLRNRMNNLKIKYKKSGD